MSAKPLLKWAGGKSNLLLQLQPLFPTAFRTYFEPSVGAGAVFFSLNLKKLSFLSDANPELMNVYEVVRQDPQALMRVLDEWAMCYSEEFFYSLRAADPSCAIERAAQFIFLNKTCFNGLYRQNSQGKFNVPFGKKEKCPTLYDKKNMLKAAQLLSRATLWTKDFEEVMSLAKKGDFIYCDPPYEPLSKTSSFNAYQGRGFSQADQVRLKEACLKAQQRGVWVVVSNSSAPFIRELYGDYPVHSVQAKRAINANAQQRGAIEEFAVLLRP